MRHTTDDGTTRMHLARKPSRTTLNQPTTETYELHLFSVRRGSLAIHYVPDDLFLAVVLAVAPIRHHISQALLRHDRLFHLECARNLLGPTVSIAPICVCARIISQPVFTY